MARSRSRGGRGARTSAATSASAQRAVRSSSRREPVEEVEPEVLEEAGGSGWESGVAVATFIGLLIALLLLDMHMGQKFDQGFLF